MDINLGGIMTTKVDKTIFVPLPKELHRLALDGVCSCGKCDGKNAMWDTLAINAEDFDRTWLVHYPELQPIPLKFEG